MARTLTSVTPNPFQADGSDTIHFFGTGFVSGDLIHWRSGSWVSSTFISSTELTYISAAMPDATSFSIEIAAADFSEATSSGITGLSTNVPAGPPDLTATSIGPTHSSIAGGAYIEITGTGFLDSDIEVFITNDGVWIPATVISPTLISIINNAGTEGPSPVLVHRLSDAQEVTLDDEFTYVTPTAYIPSPLGRDDDYYSDMTDPHAPIIYGPRTDGDWGDPL
jgi:hypothetical protein